jgi:hypothetical protein
MLKVKYSVGQVKEKNALGIYGTKQQENQTYYIYIYYLNNFFGGEGEEISIYNFLLTDLFIY